MTHKSTGRDMPWQTPWPNEGLESIDSCPVCGASQRTLLHKEIVDNVFFCSPGKWTLWQCSQCRSAYLDPRPTPDTIHQAYVNYYTHQQTGDKDDYASLSLIRKLRRRLVNGYTNWRFSTTAKPASALGVLAAFFMPSLKKVLDRQYRHMPRVPKCGGSLLDIGAGDGAFLSLARTAGWDVVGLEPDQKAAANATRRGLTVHEGGIEYFGEKTELFDVIILNHVIEHVYQPVKVLERCHALLKPGGQLWLETPNIDSFGHARFAKNWRGLEAPRHLVIFNEHSLKQTLMEAGFSTPRNQMRPSPCPGMFRASFAMECDSSPYATMAIPMALKLEVLMAAYKELYNPSRREFLTVTAYKVKK